MNEETFVIVGGGLAAARAVEAIREGGHQGPLILIGDEMTLPYDRPPLSKAVLAGTEEPESALLHPAEWYRERNVDLWLGLRASRLETTAHTLTVEGRGRLSWDRLLIARGSSPRRLAVPGTDLRNVLYLRTMRQATTLRDRLRSRRPVVIVGAGWIGLEVAAAPRVHGCDVTVVEPQPAPLQAVSGVVTTTGEHLAAATVIVGVGIIPNTQLAQEAGIEVDNGIRCDQSLRTSSPDVFAAGDVAKWFNPTLRQHIRVDHWANAQESGFAAGRSMLGEHVVHDVMPYFSSDQYDAGLEYAGHVPRGTTAQVVLRGDPAADAFVAFWLAEGRVLAGMHVNVWDTIDDVQALIASRATVDPRMLAHPLEAIVTKGQKGIALSRPDPQPDPVQ